MYDYQAATGVASQVPEEASCMFTHHSGELTPPVGGIRDLQCQVVFSIGTTPLPQASRTAEQSRVPTCTYIQ